MRKKDAQMFVKSVQRELVEYAERDISYKEMEDMEKAIDEMCSAIERVFELLGQEVDH